MNKKNQVRYLTVGASVCALYVALSFVNVPVFGAFQLRPAEALTVLPVLTSAAIPGLFLGCLLANYLTGCIAIDICLGSIATLLGAIGTRLLRRHPLLATVPPMLSNALIIPPVLVFAYGVSDAYLLLFLSVFIGELASCGLLGTLLLKAIKPISKRIFGE